MTIDEVRGALRRAREHALAGETATAVAGIDRALAELAPRRLLRPAAAAAALGIESDLVVVLWCQSGFLACQATAGDPLIPMSEIERVLEHDEVAEMRTLDRLHRLSALPGSDDGMSEDELELLSDSRPGRLPWPAMPSAE